jgi:3-hydroxy acid dehydrogenase/malonic semialdehyde reductase
MSDIPIYPRLKNKIVLITGASAGFGKSTAEYFAASGSNLILTARRFDRLESLKKDLEQKYSVKIYIAQLDVRDNAAVEKFVQGIPSEFSEIDILVNNAGLALGVAQAAENKIEDINTMIDTNVKGMLFMIRHVLPGMIQRKRPGHVINVGSVAGSEGYSGGSVYAASKFAVRGLTESLRKELVNTPIRVTHIAPGLAETEFSLVRFGGDPEKAKKPYQGLVPLTAEDIADNIVYCASRPDHVQIADMLIFPSAQASVHVVHREQQ